MKAFVFATQVMKAAVHIVSKVNFIIVHFFACYFSVCNADSDCPNHLVCDDKECVDPTCDPECANNAHCEGSDHQGTCVCDSGWSGDPDHNGCQELQCNCNSFKVMNSIGRNNDYLSGQECDNEMTPNNQDTSPDWDGPACYRLKDPAGSIIPDWEINAFSGCTTHGGGYLETKHPKTSKTVVAKVCFNEWKKGTEYICNRHVNITITNCINYFVYGLSSLTCHDIPMKYCAAKGCSAGYYNFPTCKSMYRC